MIKLVHREGLAFIEVGLCSESQPTFLSKIGVKSSLISYTPTTIFEPLYCPLYSPNNLRFPGIPTLRLRA